MVTTAGGGRGVTLGFTGDLMLGRGVNERLLSGSPPAEIWGDVHPRMLATDAMIGNLEGPITAHRTKWHGVKAFYFRADPSPGIAALQAGNYRCVALANNHMLDFGDQGLLDTRRHLAEAGIASAGAGGGAVEAAAPVIFEAGGLNVGFVSITNTVRSFAAKPGRPGTNYWKIRSDRNNLGRLATLVHDLRRGGAELIVLSIHWGPNYRWWPPHRYRRFARNAISLGVDIVHGHSAHVLQAVEFQGNGLILYDTGDYMEDFLPGPGFRSDRSFLFLVEAGPQQKPLLRMVPVSLTRAEVNVAKGREAEIIRSDMIRRCRGHAVAITEEDGDLVARPPQGAQM
jgi:poly-gamma-glutamate synthesis protein (capsule biosynthesis protein)